MKEKDNNNLYLDGDPNAIENERKKNWFKIWCLVCLSPIPRMSGKTKQNKQKKNKHLLVSGIHHSIFIEKKSSEESLSLQTTSTYFHDALLLPWYNLWKRHRPILAICVREKKIRQNVVVVFVYITLFWGSAKVRIRAQNIAHCQDSQSNCKSFFLQTNKNKKCVYIFFFSQTWRWIFKIFAQI